MIARVAQRNPDGISDEAKKNLAPVFNLDQMADAYSQQDADPVKSSGIQAKKVSYKWRTVTPEDMTNFNKAWFEIVKDNPIIALDALLAKCFGYFNVNDQPYVSMDYYVTSDYVQKNSTWIKDYNHDWREHIAGFTRVWGGIPVLGWPTHGNFYVVKMCIRDRQVGEHGARIVDGVGFVLAEVVGHAGHPVVHFAAAEVGHGDGLACRGLDHVRSGDEHVRVLTGHDDEVRQGRAVDGTAGAGAENQAQLGHEAAGLASLAEDATVLGQGGHALLDAGAAGVHDGDVYKRQSLFRRAPPYSGASAGKASE